jgi:hypothetical protein
MTDSEKYERLVRHFLETEASKSVQAFEIFGSRHYGGKSGHQHQIDVSMTFSVAGVKVLVLVECKYYSSKVKIDDVLEFATRLDDIGAHKGIVVTTIGYQEGAEKLARSKGIALVVACDLGWVPTIEAPAAATVRHREFLEHVREHLSWLHTTSAEDDINSAAAYIGQFDVTSRHGLMPQAFCSLSESGWGIRYAGGSGARHAFVVVGEDGNTHLILDSTGLCALMAVDADERLAGLPLR